MAEMIIPQEQSESKGTFVPKTSDLEATDRTKYDPYWNIIDAPLIATTVPFYIIKLADQFLARQDEGKAGQTNIKPFCFLD